MTDQPYTDLAQANNRIKELESIVKESIDMMTEIERVIDNSNQKKAELEQEAVRLNEVILSIAGGPPASSRSRVHRRGGNY